MQLREDHGGVQVECNENSQSKTPSGSVINNDTKCVVDDESLEQSQKLCQLTQRPKPGIKPIPPAKPARFKKKVSISDLVQSTTTTTRTATSISRPTVPPPVLPKSVACLRFMEEAVQRHKFEEDQCLVETTEKNCSGDSEKDSTNKPESLLHCEAAPTSSNNVVEQNSSTVTASRSDVQCNTGEATASADAEKVDISSDSKSTPKTKVPAKGILRRSTYLNDEIKKPTIQPPPPPLPAISSRVRCAAAIQKQHTFRITHSSDEVTHIEVPSSSHAECAQCNSNGQKIVTAPVMSQSVITVSEKNEHKVNEIPR